MFQWSLCKMSLKSLGRQPIPVQLLMTLGVAKRLSRVQLAAHGLQAIAWAARLDLHFTYHWCHVMC